MEVRSHRNDTCAQEKRNNLVEKINETDKISMKLYNNLHTFGWKTPIFVVFTITTKFTKLIDQITGQGNTNAKVE